jgi:TonB family protein
VISFLALGCQLAGTSGTRSASDSRGDDANVTSTAEAYRAYERGDCDAVSSSAKTTGVEGWNPNEARHSFQLIKGFCQELALDSRAARETYRLILREAPLSFASDDARERLRILRLSENDPDYYAWTMTARKRGASGSTPREAVERVPASFPPMAHRAGIGGYAVVEFGVTPRGDTDAPVVVDSNPPLLFDGVSVRAVREWRYAWKRDGAETQRQAIRLVFRPEADREEPELDATGR